MPLNKLTLDMSVQVTKDTQNSNNAYIDNNTSVALTQINNIGNASPKAVYATLAALQAAFPAGTTGIYLVTADGKWYYWFSGAWTVGGTYQATGIATGSVNEPKTSFFKQSVKNLCNPYTLNVGMYGTGGALYANATYTASDYIPVLASTVYALNKAFRWLEYFNSSKVIISTNSTGALANTNITTPALTAFMRVTFYSADLTLLDMQVELNTVPTLYEPFYYFNTNYMRQRNNDPLYLLPSKSVDYSLVKDVVPQKNLFNLANAVSGYSVVPSTGALNLSSGFYASEFIPVTPNTTYIKNSFRAHALYDINKVWISGVGSASAFTTPANCYYIRVSYYPSDGLLQLEQGSVSTPYTDFGVKLPSYYFNNDFFQLMLPNELCVAVGKSIEIYNKQICHCGNILNYHFVYSCSIGKTFKRKWCYTAVIGDIGTKVLTVNIYDNNMNIISSGTINIRIVNISSAILNKKMLCIGDSLTNAGVFITEFKAQADAMFGTNNLQFIGTQGSTNKHEGYGGWSTASFISSGSPFWNSGASQVDFANYITVNSLTQPDYVQIFLGTNDVFGMADGKYPDVLILSNTCIARIKTLVDKILAQWVGTRIFIVLPQFYADQNGLGTNYGNTAHDMARHLQVLAFCQSILTQFIGYNSKVSIVGIASTFDSDFGFTSLTQAVNPWSSTTEVFVTGGVHPSNEGYNQMGDMMFSHFVGHYLDT
jgi:lysophospholipase L1-like esterase